MAFNKQYVDSPLNSRTKLLYLGDTYKKMVLNGLIVHDYDNDSNVLQEYDDCGEIEYISELPDPKKINPNKCKMLLIIEDMNLSTLNRTEKEKINRLFGYSSSHRGVSLCITSQNPLDIPVSARRMCNIFTIYKIPDLCGLMLMASRTGYKKDDFVQFFKMCTDCHDNVTIDLTQNTPAPLRFNMFQQIAKDND